MAPWEDRISNLSDELICHILSFISTKHAATTGVLSKRWKNIWLSVPLLHFSDVKLGNEISILLFNHFVLSVMLSRVHAGNHSIDSFYLDIGYANINHVDSLLNLTTAFNHLVQCKVKHLHLHLYLLNDRVDALPKFQTPKLPNSIFYCKTLVVLNLSRLSLKDFSFSSDGFGFPSLKTLHLNHVTFDDDQDFWLLLAGCPILEDIKAHDVFTSEEATEFQVFHNLHLRKLIRADIIIFYCDFPMKALFNLEFLRIQLWEMYAPYDFPTFNNLTHLVINTDWDLFIQVLYHCPKLQKLELYQKMDPDRDEDIEGREREIGWVDPKSAPECLSYIRACIIWDFAFGDRQHDILLATYILNNAIDLQTMIVWSHKEQPQIERELSSCPRASTICQLSVY